MFDFAESFDVFVVCSVLANLESAIRFDEYFWQLGKPMQKEPVGYQHQVAVPMLSGELDVLNDRRIQERFATEQCESFRFQTI